MNKEFLLLVGGFAIGGAIASFIWYSKPLHEKPPKHNIPPEEEQLLQNVDNPAIKNAYINLRSEHEELKEQLQETHKRSKIYISEIQAEREELLSQLLDKDIFTLTYFDTRGRAEQIRLLLAECGASFNDLRVTRENWSDPEFGYSSKTPLGVLPILEHNGRVIGESIAIMVYLAKIYDRWPTKPDNEAITLMILTASDDFRRILDPVRNSSDHHQKTQSTKKLVDFLNKRLPHFEKLLEQDGFFSLGRITAADIAFWDVLNQISDENELFSEIINSFKQIHSFLDRISSLPRISRYLKKRK